MKVYALPILLCITFSAHAVNPIINSLIECDTLFMESGERFFGKITDLKGYDVTFNDCATGEKSKAPLDKVVRIGYTSPSDKTAKRVAALHQFLRSETKYEKEVRTGKAEGLRIKKHYPLILIGVLLMVFGLVFFGLGVVVGAVAGFSSALTGGNTSQQESEAESLIAVGFLSFFTGLFFSIKGFLRRRRRRRRKK